MHAHKPQDGGFFGPREHLRGYAAGIVHAHIQAAHLLFLQTATTQKASVNINFLTEPLSQWEIIFGAD